MPVPLAARLRPTRLDEIHGQRHLVAPDAGFRRAAERGKPGSFLLWGPPGVGKTTLAEIVAKLSGARFERLSAVSAGVADLRRVVAEAKNSGLFSGPTVMFIDEIHRFNKAQQDAILPYVEDGTLILIGATTENPSFEVNAALRSRLRTYVLQPLSDEDLRAVLKRGERELDQSVSESAADLLINLANGDARSLLNMLEASAGLADDIVEEEHVRAAVHERARVYDKDGEEHFNLISALHKSVRGSDPDASLYWLARMLESGEDPMYLARRIVRMASEDIGLADPQALVLAISAQQAIHLLGMPEGGLALAQAVVYLSLAPKSNALYVAYKVVLGDVRNTRNDPVPLHLRNASTGLMNELGYGNGYRYAHDHEGGLVAQQNLPDALAERRYYEPTDRGREARYAERLQEIRARWTATAGPEPSSTSPS